MPKERQKFNITGALAKVNESNKKVIGSIPELSFAKTHIKNIFYKDIHFGQWKKYEIKTNEVIDLVESLASIGLEQNLVVKETEQDHYIIVTGHKRLTAINYIFDQKIRVADNILPTLEYPACVIIPKEEADLITQLRMHDTNIHARNTISFDMIEDYYDTIAKIQAQNLKINGKSITGKTREILMQQFNFSDGTAKKYVKILKNGDESLKKKIRNGEISINAAYNKLVKTDKNKGGNIATPAKSGKVEKPSDTKDDHYTFDSLKKDLIGNYNEFQNIMKRLISEDELLQSEIIIDKASQQKQSVKDLIKRSGLIELNDDYYTALSILAPEEKK